MVRIFKAEESDFQELKSFGKFRLQTAVPRLSGIVEASQMLFDLRWLNPGSYSFPYHFHRSAEELFFFISGSATLRTPEGFREVSAGDLVFFGMGKKGAHQLYNSTEEPCVYLDLRTNQGIDVCEYPDSGKISILPFQEAFDKQSQVGYFGGEENVDEKWER